MPSFIADPIIFNEAATNRSKTRFTKKQISYLKKKKPKSNHVKNDDKFIKKISKRIRYKEEEANESKKKNKKANLTIHGRKKTTTK